MKWNKFKERFEVWSLFYRQEIIWFIAGFVLGAIIL
jgi:hypothetical protein